jgi:cytochrome P450
MYILLVHGMFVCFLLQDMLAGAVDSSSLTMEWALSELIRHPKIMKKAQEELDTFVGRTRPVLMSDLPNLLYLQAIIKETFRLYPAFPLGVPHFNSKDVQILNYKIPANTNVLINIWAIGRDPKIWKKPLEFDPDRFPIPISMLEGRIIIWYHLDQVVDNALVWILRNSWCNIVLQQFFMCLIGFQHQAFNLKT